jgi:hypothetical protein
MGRGSDESRSGGLQGSRSTHQSSGKHKDTAQQAEHPVYGKAQQPKRNQQQPHERINDKRKQSQRPAKHEQNAPKQEIHHTWKIRSRIASGSLNAIPPCPS